MEVEVMILDEIVAFKKEQLKIQKSQLKPELMSVLAKNYKRKPISFREALIDEGISIIGEVKKASPSKGVIRKDFDPIQIAKTYETCGVKALSVLTETQFFKGSLEYLKDIRKVVNLPILRKDFIIDTYQIDEAYLSGADAILLIVKILEDKALQTFIAHAKQYGMDVLVEVHDEEEVERAVKAGADIIGINNRDLTTFNTTLETTKRLIPYITGKRVIVSESGISKVEDMNAIKTMGVDAVLIGEAFMRVDNPRDLLETFKYA